MCWLLHVSVTRNQSSLQAQQASTAAVAILEHFTAAFYVLLVLVTPRLQLFYNFIQLRDFVVYCKPALSIRGSRTPPLFPLVLC
jgi:hypothetical protein